MYTLAAADTLAGGADAATKVTVTVFGMELNAGTETYKALYQGQLGNTAATLYTVPASTTAFVKSVSVVNTDTVTRTFTLYRGGTAAANQITPTISLAAGAFAIYEDGDGWQLNLNGTTYAGYYPGVMGLSGCKGATFDRALTPEVNTTLVTTGQIFLQAVWLPVGTVVSSIRAWCATTASATQTATNMGLYDTSGNRLATGTDGGSSVWAANTVRNFTMGSPYTVTASGLFYIAFSVVATTVGTYKGTTARTGGQITLATPPLAGISATTYTSGSMPATVAVPAAVSTVSLYAEVF